MALLIDCPHCGTTLDCTDLNGNGQCPHCVGPFPLPRDSGKRGRKKKEAEVRRYGGHTPPQRRAASRPLMSPRGLYRCVFSIFLFGPFVFTFCLSFLLAPVHEGLGIVMGMLACPGFVWLFIGFFPARWMARLLLVATVSRISCPHCGFEIEAVGRWTSGSYTDHRERHIFAFKNPIDGSLVGHTNCPMCDTTILIQ